MRKQRKSPPQARLLPATWRLLPATAATKRLDFCGEGRRLNGQGLHALAGTTCLHACRHVLTTSGLTCRPGVKPLPSSLSALVRGLGSGAMWPRGSARQPLLCGTGAPAQSVSPQCPLVSVRTAPRARDRRSRRRAAGSLLVGYLVPPRGLCAATKQTQSPDGVFFNRAPELGRLRQVLSSPPTSVLVLTGPPSCGKSGAYLRPAVC